MSEKTFSVLYCREIPLWSVMEWTDDNGDWFTKDILPVPSTAAWRIKAETAADALAQAQATQEANKE